MVGTAAVAVRVTWTDRRNTPFTGDRYITPATFPPEFEAAQRGNLWSMVLEFPEGAALASEFDATARFLMDEAPHELLRPGATFLMHEGPTLTAQVVVL